MGGKSIPHGCGIRLWTQNPGAKILCYTNLTIPQYTGLRNPWILLRLRNPGSFGRLCNLYVNPSEWDGIDGPGHFCQPKALCYWQCPNNWTRFSSKRLLNAPTTYIPHIGQRQYLTNWITCIPHHQQAVSKTRIVEQYEFRNTHYTWQPCLARMIFIQAYPQPCLSVRTRRLTF